MYRFLRRTWYGRLARGATAVVALAAALGAWSGEAGGRVACPHHLGVLSQLITDGPAGAPHHGVKHQHGGHGPASEGDAAPCSCVGTCTVGIGAAWDVSGAVVPAVPLATHARVGSVDVGQPRRLLSPFFIPYGTAPPRFT